MLNKIENIINNINNMKIYDIDKKFEYIETNIEELKNTHINSIYSKIISAENDIEQSYYEKDDIQRCYIQCEAQCKLNEGILTLQQHFISIIKYFVDWDNENVISRNFGNRKYSDNNIKKYINQLCEDYVYLRKGINILIKLKKNQGIYECVVKQQERLEALYDMIDKNKIYNWLPPENDENSWQHQLLYGEKYKTLTTEKIDLKTKAKEFLFKHFKRGGEKENDM